MTIYKTITKGVRLVLCLSILGFAACKGDDDHQDISIPSNGTAVVQNFTPLAGGSGTELSFYGSGFPTDLEKIRITVNGVDAEVKSSNGRVITSSVAQNSGSGEVILYINGEPIKMNRSFQYGYQLVASTYAGGEKGNVDGALASAKIANPRKMIFDKEGAMYILCGDVTSPSSSDYVSIRKIENGQVTTVWKDDYQNSRIQKPRAIAFSKDQNTIYLTADKQGKGTMFFKLERQADGTFGAPVSLLKEVDTPLMLEVVVHPTTGDIFLACYNKPSGVYKYNPADDSMKPMLDIIPDKSSTVTGMVFSPDGSKLYIAYAYNGRGIFQADYDAASGRLSGLKVFAGKGNNDQGYVEAVGTSAMFREPMQMDVDKEGNVYVADCTNHCIRKIMPDGTTSAYAGKGDNAGADKTKGYLDGQASSAQFDKPMGVQFGPDGNLYVAENGGHRIRKIAQQ